MSTAKDEFDTGPLSWVERELEFALTRADEGISDFSAKPQDHNLARATLPHLHQVSGVLRMVSLEPVDKVSGAIEKLVEALDRGDVKASSDVTNTARAAIKALTRYLKGLMRGEPNRPLTLFPAYQAVLAATGSEKANEIDFFCPDLTQVPRFREPAANRQSTELATLVTLKRGEFQKGLLNLLRGTDYRQSLGTMRGALAAIETMVPAGQRVLLWIAVGFLEGVANCPGPPDVLQKQLCGRIDQHIKRQAQGTEVASERLIRELLFVIAHMQPTTQRIREIQQTYRLTNLLPPAAQESPETTRVKLFLRDIKDQLEIVKETWVNFTAGNQASLNQFFEQTAQLNKFAQTINNKSLQAVFAKLAEVGYDLNSNPRNPGEAVAIEIATALLVARDALDNYPQLGPNFKQLAETVVVRVSAAMRGRPLPENTPRRLNDIPWAAREKQLFFHLGQEILTNLNHIEEVLDAFFRDPTKRSGLATLPASIHQVEGALTMLESDDAVQLLKAAHRLVKKFATGAGPPDAQDSELTAEAFSNLGHFISALQQGRENPNELLRAALTRFGISPSPSIAPLPQSPGESAFQVVKGI
jgi:chemosensory pili system protein ChpA (sensor histidine kinase/response regulator)